MGSGWVIIVVVIALLLLLAVGGAIAAARRMDASSAGFTDHLDRANADLAKAHAADRGWEPEALQRAATEALDERHPDMEVSALTLVEVVDRPGVSEDIARYRVQVTDGSELLITLVRHGDRWTADRIEG